VVSRKRRRAGRWVGRLMGIDDTPDLMCRVKPMCPKDAG
jgi:hypothetical protein